MNARPNLHHDSLPVAPPPSRILDHFYSDDAPRFRIGDCITFEKADGTVGIVTILGQDPTGEVECMFFNGLSHRVAVSIDDLCDLRIVRIETMLAEDVAMYRRLLGLGPQEAEAA